MKDYSKHDTAKIKRYQLILGHKEHNSGFIYNFKSNSWNITNYSLDSQIIQFWFHLYSSSQVGQYCKILWDFKFYLARSLNICSSQLQRISSFCTQPPIIGIEGLQKASDRAYVFVDITLLKVSL